MSYGNVYLKCNDCLKVVQVVCTKCRSYNLSVDGEIATCECGAKFGYVTCKCDSRLSFSQMATQEEKTISDTKTEKKNQRIMIAFVVVFFLVIAFVLFHNNQTDDTYASSTTTTPTTAAVPSEPQVPVADPAPTAPLASSGVHILSGKWILAPSGSSLDYSSRMKISMGSDEDHGTVTFLQGNNVGSMSYEVYDYETKAEDDGSTMYTFRVHLTEDNDVVDQTWVYAHGTGGYFLAVAKTGDADNMTMWKKVGK